MNLKLAFVKERIMPTVPEKTYVYIDIYFHLNSHKHKNAYYFLYFPASRSQSSEKLINLATVIQIVGVCVWGGAGGGQGGICF